MTAYDPDMPEWLADESPSFNIPYTDNLEATNKGLIITGQPDFNTWYSLWQWLKDRDKAMPWILGDMMVYGESAFGEQASQVLDDDVEQEHFTPGTLKQYKYVAQAWPQSSRLDGIPWSYHQTVAHLPMEQRLALLQHCQEHGIRRAELRTMVRELNGGQQPNPPARLDDLNHELIEDNHKKDRRIDLQEETISQQQEYINHLESQLTEMQQIQQAVIIDTAGDEPVLTSDVGRARGCLEYFLNETGYSAVTIYADGATKWHK